MILAVYESGNFQWITIAESKEEAERELLAASRRHCDRLNPRGTTSNRFMRDAVADGDINFYPITPGVVLRDGSPI